MITKIEEGQKLKDGDHVIGINRKNSDYIQIFYANNLPPIHNTTKSFGFIFSDGKLINHSHGLKKTNYSFEAFKQLCENTFGL